MRFMDLGLRPSLQEGIPSIDTELEIQMLNKIEQKIAQQRNLSRRKKRLSAILQKIDTKL